MEKYLFDAFQITEGSPFASLMYSLVKHNVSCIGSYSMWIQWIEKRIFNAKNLSRAEMHRRLLYILLVISWADQLTNNLREMGKKGKTTKRMNTANWYSLRKCKA